MSRDTKTQSGSVGCSGFFVACLTLIFIFLKMAGYIEWAWLWVLAPIWISGIVTAALIVVALVILVIAEYS